MHRLSVLNKVVLISLFVVTFFFESAFSAHVTSSQAISFGSIIASHTGDVIEIDARNGSAIPFVLTSGYTHLEGDGFSGIIRVLSDISGQTIILTYPASVILEEPPGPSSETMVLDAIDIRSKTSAVSTTAGEEIEFNIGGRLHINSGQNGDLYTGTMTVTVDVYNP